MLKAPSSAVGSAVKAMRIATEEEPEVDSSVAGKNEAAAVRAAWLTLER